MAVIGNFKPSVTTKIHMELIIQKFSKSSTHLSNLSITLSSRSTRAMNNFRRISQERLTR